MQMNPCGRLVDFGRREYVTKSKVFKDSDQLVKIRYYRTSPFAPGMPWPIFQVSQDWDSSPWARSGLGEQFGEARVWHKPAPPVPLGLVDHFCGTQDQFQNGSPMGPDLDILANGLPRCCKIFAGEGGLSLSGTAFINDVRYTAEGGVAIGGTAPSERCLANNCCTDVGLPCTIYLRITSTCACFDDWVIAVHQIDRGGWQNEIPASPCNGPGITGTAEVDCLSPATGFRLLILGWQFQCQVLVSDSVSFSCDPFQIVWNTIMRPDFACPNCPPGTSLTITATGIPPDMTAEISDAELLADVQRRRARRRPSDPDVATST